MSIQVTPDDESFGAPPVHRQYDPEPRRDSVRAGITVFLVLTFIGIVGAALYAAQGDFDKTKEMIDKPLPSLTGLIGTALGFYFGMRNTTAAG